MIYTAYPSLCCSHLAETFNEGSPPGVYSVFFLEDSPLNTHPHMMRLKISSLSRLTNHSLNIKVN